MDASLPSTTMHGASLLAGGLGLFLLGMTMMTDGLRLAAGPALERILAGATRTRWHALGSGMLITAMVQSSSAVTVATIGFVNAGLMGLGGALWVLFGANVGTTMTGWIVALVGLRLDVEDLALPLVGAGVLLRLAGRGQRAAAVGTALAGFGLLFLGIALLQQSFTSLAGRIGLPDGEGAATVPMQLAIGALLTVLMQSSSASMTVALTAAQQGLLSPEGAAAVVIGANIGTTVTAVLAAIGATPNARRTAAAHVIFNALTGAVALLLLPWLIDAIALARHALSLPADPAARLALFHTLFNLMGVVLIWPVADALTHWLQRRFRRREEDEGQPAFLDDNVLTVPALAVEALQREVGRFGALSRRVLRAALEGADAAVVQSREREAQRLETAIESFVERMNRSEMQAGTSARLARLLRLQRYHESTVEQALVAAATRDTPGPGVPDAGEFRQAAGVLLQSLDGLHDDGDPHGGAPVPELLAATAAQVTAAEAAYQRHKQALIEAGATGRLAVAEMEGRLRRHSALRRALEQTVKGRGIALSTPQPLG